MKKLPRLSLTIVVLLLLHFGAVQIVRSASNDEQIALSRLESTGAFRVFSPNKKNYVSITFFGRTEQLSAAEEVLGQLRDVRYFSVKRGATDANIRFLTNWRSLERLDLNSSYVTDNGLKVLDSLNLRELNLESVHITDAGLRNVSRQRELRRLGLHCLAITDKGLESLPNLAKLEDLDLSFTGLSDGSIESIKLLTSIRKLDLSYTDVTDRGIEKLTNLKQLRELNVKCTLVKTPPATLLRDNRELKIIGLPTKEELANMDDPEVVSAFSQIGVSIEKDGNRNVVTIDAANLKGDPSRMFLSIPRLHSLERITLPPQTTDAQLAVIGRVKSLKSLELNHAGVTDNAMVHLAALKELRHLSLAGCNRVSDAGIARLSDLKHLEELYLDKINLTSKGLARLAGLTALRGLSLRDTKIDDAGIGHLGKLKSLFSLELDSTSVSDTGLNSLASLPSLVVLSVFDTRVTKDGIARLRQKAPRIEVASERGN